MEPTATVPQEVLVQKLYFKKEVEVETLSFSSLFGDFKMTAKNSVEHISPQHKRETDRNTVSENVLHKFGNLALVSRSVNSEYSDLPFNEKRQRFLNNNGKSLDSLKMDLIYENKEWNDKIALQHEEEMVDLFENYINT